MTLSKAEARVKGRLSDRVMRFMGPWGLFLKGFIKNPVMVGSIVPTSSLVIDKMLSRVDWSQVDVFVEYGPGVGTFCRPVLEKLRGDAMLIAIDTNPDFVDFLKRDIADSRFHVVHGSAEDVIDIVRAHGFEHADHVLSGMPLSTLPPGVAMAIAEATHAVLRPGGSFLIYQYRRWSLRLLKPFFAKIEQGFELVNVPPCFLFWATK